MKRKDIQYASSLNQIIPVAIKKRKQINPDASNWQHILFPIHGKLVWTIIKKKDSPYHHPHPGRIIHT